MPQISKMLLFVSNINMVLIRAIFGISIIIVKLFVFVPSYISVIQIWNGAAPILNKIIVSMRLLLLLISVFSSMVYLFCSYLVNSIPVISIVDDIALRIKYLMLASFL